MFEHGGSERAFLGVFITFLTTVLGDARAEVPSGSSWVVAARSIEFREVEDVVGFPESAVGLRRLAEEYSQAARGVTALHVSVTSGGASAVLVPPGSEVGYEVTGVLGDDANEGLALVGFDLDFDGGSLTQADSPTGVPTEGCDDPGNHPPACCENPMIHFTEPWGITNPAGFGGTIINGDLIQIGGGQNTIKNTPDHAPFPIGPVVTGVAQPSVCGPTVLVTGSLVAPLTDGTYTLALESLFANVIRDGEDGSGVFWATEAATAGTIQHLSITVTHEGACCALTGVCMEDDEAVCVNSGGTFRGVATVCGEDGDVDGVADACDLCPRTPAGRRVDSQGCDRPKSNGRIQDIR